MFKKLGLEWSHFLLALLLLVVWYLSGFVLPLLGIQNAGIKSLGLLYIIQYVEIALAAAFVLAILFFKGFGYLGRVLLVFGLLFLLCYLVIAFIVFA
ncbi:hypothetical protein A2949_02925 [Candidatus Adlerbacteria bacterium RIFCSPLOWO2_01_FULL_54_21b]|uniref:Uncharacterized protein n=1 Tax=Candidatus Adlerbacteria bacterium RIFCSPLOWO2_01_FULL_54_21b TaxID=1797245 RepID=A0A1F4XXR3_9BACT|nr:MAG: hypothetical protein A2949_02925 [Candidatus Adlerbacteria bacterium RIFCSPLOWO2_01_FULL_54_21b]